MDMEKISKAQIKTVRSLQVKKFRDELGLFVAEGDKCVSELTKAFELVHLYREDENATRTEIEQMSGLRTPQGVIGVFKKRELSTFNFKLSTFNFNFSLRRRTGSWEFGNDHSYLRLVWCARYRLFARHGGLL